MLTEFCTHRLECTVLMVSVSTLAWEHWVGKE